MISTTPISFAPSAIATRRSTCSPSRSKTFASLGPKRALDWGIELPFDDKYVTYVWYDAFWAYVSELPNTDDAALQEILPRTEHFIGKDILKTHAVYWPAMLMTAGLPLYQPPERPRLV